MIDLFTNYQWLKSNDDLLLDRMWEFVNASLPILYISLSIHNMKCFEKSQK